MASQQQGNTTKEYFVKVKKYFTKKIKIYKISN